MARTRAAKATPAAKTEQQADAAPEAKYALPETTSEPPKLFILPTALSGDALIVSLPNPRYAKPTRYLVCPEKGIFEFTKISAPKTTPRSFLVEPAHGETETVDSDAARFQAHVTDGADLFVATAMDPVFLILPGLFGPATTKSDAKRLFLSSEDHFDALSNSDTSSDLADVLRCEKTRARLERRMEAVSDTVDAGDEKMYRLSEPKLARLILSKARAMGAGGLPPSMEDKFVTKPLEAPLLVQQSSAVGAAAKKESPGDAASTPGTESAESQASTATADSTASLASEASTAATSVGGEPAEEGVVSSMRAAPDIVALQRLRVAFGFICASYVPPGIAARLRELLRDPEAGVDFAPLDAYLEDLARARAEANASRSMTDYSRKRQVDEEEEEARAEKRRRMEEEKKRKAGESRGVKNLRKVNTTGMKKMSDFFQKKT